MIAVVGRNYLSEREWRAAGLSAVYALADVEPDPATCMRDAHRLLSHVSSTVANDWLTPATGATGST